jgi:hypothetical protein
MGGEAGRCTIDGKGRLTIGSLTNGSAASQIAVGRRTAWGLENGVGSRCGLPGMGAQSGERRRQLRRLRRRGDPRGARQKRSSFVTGGRWRQVAWCGHMQGQAGRRNRCRDPSEDRKTPKRTRRKEMQKKQTDAQRVLDQGKRLYLPRDVQGRPLQRVRECKTRYEVTGCDAMRRGARRRDELA